ncbi:hypothetical protein AX279_12920 [Pseudomonas sp. J237]|nr:MULTISPECIES: DUF2059 domain-containing protein [Pseudomonas]OEO25397.1 hypothetical protein AX279_12920 [Pseudomonas sp. J237]
MPRLSAVFAVALLAVGSANAFADAASHAADAERFLLLARADKLAAPVHAQVQQMFAQRFAESGSPKGKEATLERYQAKANAAIDSAVGWDKIKPDMIKLYTSNFSEPELKELIKFYQSPLGKKFMQKMPELTARSAQLTQAKLQVAVPQVNKMLQDMTDEVAPKKP